ncbi:hypothetical protein CTAYLR_004290 [Chrysophaeum taylorii]|uniref:SCP domain-containing protein n=1 Tax=Chrysophaeum taylorii TaxID=2483200 RepID=A0AAD7UGG2_9STRA|nr:hypothetical protein CTAYLR_004290 [Chrysophaeum taylorii]
MAESASDAQALEALTFLCSVDAKRAQRLFAAAQRRSFAEAIVREHNFARAKPAEYAETRVVPLLDKFDGTTFDNALSTREGRKCAEELANVLRETEPCQPLELDAGISKAAQRHADDVGANGIMAHVGTDGSEVGDRLRREGEWWGSCAENLSFGFETPEDVVLWLLIDDGVPSRGHRKNILDGSLQRVGCSTPTEHETGTCVVLDYAAAAFGPPERIHPTNDPAAILAALPHGLDALRREIETALVSPFTTVHLEYAPGSLEVKFVVNDGTETTTTTTKKATWSAT